MLFHDPKTASWAPTCTSEPKIASTPDCKHGHSDAFKRFPAETPIKGAPIPPREITTQAGEQTKHKANDEATPRARQVDDEQEDRENTQAPYRSMPRREEARGRNQVFEDKAGAMSAARLGVEDETDWWGVELETPNSSRSRREESRTEVEDRADTAVEAKAGLDEENWWKSLSTPKGGGPQPREGREKRVKNRVAKTTPQARSMEVHKDYPDATTPYTE